MADFSQFFPTLMQEEGGSKLTNNSGDRGGWTKWGITLATWVQEGVDEDGDGDIDLQDLKLSTAEDAERIAKKICWDPIHADAIDSQSVAEFTADWGYNSGRKTAAKHLQRLVGAEVDGVIGEQTIGIVNKKQHLALFNALKEDRKKFFLAIIANDPSQIVNKKGWFNRVDNFQFKN